jgi:hypothetical protein
MFERWLGNHASSSTSARDDVSQVLHNDPGVEVRTPANNSQPEAFSTIQCSIKVFHAVPRRHVRCVERQVLQYNYCLVQLAFRGRIGEPFGEYTRPRQSFRIAIGRVSFDLGILGRLTSRLRRRWSVLRRLGL